MECGSRTSKMVSAKSGSDSMWLLIVSLGQRGSYRSKLRTVVEMGQEIWDIVTDCEVWSWPWQWFDMEKSDCSLFVICNGNIRVSNTLGSSEVVFCTCELIQLLCVIFYIVRPVYKFDIKPAINKKSASCGVRDSCFWHDLYVIPPELLRECYWTLNIQYRSTVFSWVRDIILLAVPIDLVCKHVKSVSSRLHKCVEIFWTLLKSETIQ
jgi:hypothetical protein